MAWLLHDIFHKLCPDEYVKNWHISGNSFSTSPFTQSLLWLWLWLWFCWTQKMVWKFWLGESGACLCDRQPTHGPCTPRSVNRPVHRKNVLFIRSENWTFIQFFDWTFNQYSTTEREWVLTQFYGWTQTMTISHFLNVIQTLDIFCRSHRQFCRAVTYWFCWGFLNLPFFARHFLPLQFLCQNLPKNILLEILNDFNRLQIFFQFGYYGTGHALTYHERERNLRFTGGSAGDRQYATFGFNEAFLT